MMLPEFLSQREKEKFFRTLNDEQKIDALNEIIEESKHIVFLGGAGVSTESGIPDFGVRTDYTIRRTVSFEIINPSICSALIVLTRSRRYFSPISEKIWIVGFYSLMMRIRNWRKWS